jgi:hypothetical protein
MVYLSVPEPVSRLPVATYVEVLDADHADETLDFFEPVHMDSSDPAGFDEL